MNKHSHYRGPRKTRENGVEKSSEEIIAENFPTWGRKQTPKSKYHIVPNKMNPRKSAPWHILIKMSKVKDKKKNLKSSKRKKVTY